VSGERRLFQVKRPRANFGPPPQQSIEEFVQWLVQLRTLQGFDRLARNVEDLAGVAELLETLLGFLLSALLHHAQEVVDSRFPPLPAGGVKTIASHGRLEALAHRLVQRRAIDTRGQVPLRLAHVRHIRKCHAARQLTRGFAGCDVQNPRRLHGAGQQRRGARFSGQCGQIGHREQLMFFALPDEIVFECFHLRSCVAIKTRQQHARLGHAIGFFILQAGEREQRGITIPGQDFTEISQRQRAGRSVRR
jgi:hypothetical protein